MTSFSDIYILNLHGSARKREKSPDGSRDENVFDIAQGMAICLFVKKPGVHKEAHIYYADLWGLRESKYNALAETDVASTQWTCLDPRAEQFFFVPKDFSASEEYENFVGIQELFLQSSTGIQTKRDGLVYHFTKEELERTLKDIASLSSLDLTERYALPPDGRDWTVEAARKDVLSKRGTLTRVLYHPFDHRWTLYTGKTKGLMAYPRYPFMGNALQNNLLLLGIRNARRGKVDSFFVANSLVDKDAVSPFDNAIFFPLYLYPASRQASLFVESTPADVPDGRRCNLTTACTRDVAERLNMHFLYDGRGNLQQNFGPEDIFHYLYALFHSPAYRARYAEFLRIDFPSVPFTSNGLLFCDLCVLGERLVGLHLMERIGTITTRYPEKGNNVIEKVDCTCLASESEKSRVWINETQYFAGIPPEFWDFQIGGYQVCSRWLKDRKGRSLGFHDIQHYQRIVAALAETVTIMGQIDKAVEERGGWPIE